MIIYDTVLLYITTYNACKYFARTTVLNLIMWNDKTEKWLTVIGSESGCTYIQ